MVSIQRIDAKLQIKKFSFQNEEISKYSFGDQVNDKLNWKILINNFI